MVNVDLHSITDDPYYLVEKLASRFPKVLIRLDLLELTQEEFYDLFKGILQVKIANI